MESFGACGRWRKDLCPPTPLVCVLPSWVARWDRRDPQSVGVARMKELEQYFTAWGNAIVSGFMIHSCNKCTFESESRAVIISDLRRELNVSRGADVRYYRNQSVLQIGKSAHSEELYTPRDRWGRSGFFYARTVFGHRVLTEYAPFPLFEGEKTDVWHASSTHGCGGVISYQYQDTPPSVLCYSPETYCVFKKILAWICVYRFS